MPFLYTEEELISNLGVIIAVDSGGGGGGSGTVTSVSAIGNNGITTNVANPNTTPQITIGLADSLNLTGSPTTTTQTQGDNSTKIATTAYVDVGLATKYTKPSANLQEIYVDTLRGDDINNDGSFGSPLKTLNAALEDVADGGFINVIRYFSAEAGTDNCNVDNKSCTIRGIGLQKPIITISIALGDLNAPCKITVENINVQSLSANIFGGLNNAGIIIDLYNCIVQNFRLFQPVPLSSSIFVKLYNSQYYDSGHNFQANQNGTCIIYNFPGTFPIDAITGLPTNNYLVSPNPRIVVNNTIANATQTGLLSSSDWNTFNNKINNTLPASNILVGNAGNIASAVPLSGDATIDNTGNITTFVKQSATPTPGSILLRQQQVYLGDPNGGVYQFMGNATAQPILVNTPPFRFSLSKTLSPSITVNNATSYNLMTAVTAADVAAATTSNFNYIATGFSYNTTNVSLVFPPFQSYIDYKIRVQLQGTIGGTTGTDRQFTLELRRGSDNSLVLGDYIVKIDGNALTNLTRVYTSFSDGLADPFIAGGLRVVLNNNSGTTITLTGFSLLVQGTPTNFIQ